MSDCQQVRVKGRFLGYVQKDSDGTWMALDRDGNPYWPATYEQDGGFKTQARAKQMVEVGAEVEDEGKVA